MSRQAEGRIQDDVIRRLKTEFPDIKINKLSDRYTRGMFDLLVMLNMDRRDGLSPCEHTHMEVKQPGEDLSELQKREADALSAVGAAWVVVSSPEQAWQFIRHGKKHHASVESDCPAGWRLQWDDEKQDNKKGKVRR